MQNSPPKDAMAKDTLYLLMFSLNARPQTVCADSMLAKTVGVALKAGNYTAPESQHMPNKGVRWCHQYAPNVSDEHDCGGCTVQHCGVGSLPPS